MPRLPVGYVEYVFPFKPNVETACHKVANPRRGKHLALLLNALLLFLFGFFDTGLYYVAPSARDGLQRHFVALVKTRTPPGIHIRRPDNIAVGALVFQENPQQPIVEIHDIVLFNVYGVLRFFKIHILPNDKIIAHF